MIIACVTIFIGTLYPIFIETLTNERISVGAPYYNSTVIPIILPGLFLMGVAPALSWQTNKLNNGKNFIYLVTIVFFFTVIFSLTTEFNIWGVVGISVGLWVILTSIYYFFKNFFSLSKKKLLDIILINNGILAHFGVGILILGITFSSVYKLEYENSIEVNEELSFGKYELKLNNIINVDKKNFKSLKGDFSLSKNGKFLYNIYPEKRYYYVTKIITTEAGIYHHPLQDFYLVMGEQKNNKITIKFFQNPLVSLIWLGGLIIFLSGTLTLRKK